jgi:lysozyme
MAELSRRGEAFITHFEGVYTHLYNDPAGHCTIGVGHLVHHGPCNGSEPASFRNGISRTQAVELLRKDAKPFAREVERLVTVPLEQHQLDALVSFAYNVGLGAFGSSTLLRKLNQGNYDAVPSELARWVKGGGKTLPGLVRRRRAEGDLFEGGDYDPGPNAQIATDDGAAHPDQQPASVRDVQAALEAIGWPLKVDGVAGPKTREAVADFQLGFTFSKLRVDGVAGPQTFKAIQRSAGNGGRCSEHFAFREFTSKGDGWIRVHRALVDALETYRAAIGQPVNLRSGYRDPRYNKEAGGKPQSQHLYGCASDIPGVLTVAEIQRLRVFSGMGYNSASGKVVHVDVRHAGPNNVTGGTPAKPTVWPY